MFGYQVLGFGSGAGAAGYDIEFMVVAGAGSGAVGGHNGGDGGGGGGGGYRTSPQAVEPGGGDITITVGTGGPSPGNSQRNDGQDSSITGAVLTEAILGIRTSSIHTFIILIHLSTV